jgi:hypothetical protein
VRLTKTRITRSQHAAKELRSSTRSEAVVNAATAARSHRSSTYTQHRSIIAATYIGRPHADDVHRSTQLTAVDRAEDVQLIAATKTTVKERKPLQHAKTQPSRKDAATAVIGSTQLTQLIAAIVADG